MGSTGHRLWAPAAEKLTQLIAGAAADGVTVGITDSYRSYEAQVDVAERKGLYKNGGLAAVPGTSDHGWGMAVDLSLDGKAQTWMREHAGEYGFTEDTLVNRGTGGTTADRDGPLTSGGGPPIEGVQGPTDGPGRQYAAAGL
ncbi:M15 family metallopeptidase [Cellulomonas soli]